MKTLILAICFFLPVGAWSQIVEVSGIVMNGDDQPLSGAKLINVEGEQLGQLTNEMGTFSFLAEKSTKFGVVLPGYDTKWLIVQERDYFIRLKWHVQEIAPIIISRKNTEDALDLENVNILAYQPLENGILTLKKEKGNYYLGLDNIRSEGVSYELPMKKPKEFFFDCLSKPYLITSDSAYQFSLVDSNLIINDRVSISHFRQEIFPCVASFESSFVDKSFVNFNQSYVLYSHSKEGSDRFYEYTDVESYQAAWEAYGNLVVAISANDFTIDPMTMEQFYQEQRRERRDIYGINDTGRDFMRSLDQQNLDFSREQFASMSPEGMNANDFIPDLSLVHEKFGEDVASKKMGELQADFLVPSTPVRVETFQLGDHMVIVNCEIDSVLIMNKNGSYLKKSSFDNSAIVEQVLQDWDSGEIYLYTKENGGHKVYSLDIFTGKSTFVKDFGILQHASDVKVYGDYLYFRVMENQFYELNRVRLPKDSNRKPN